MPSELSGGMARRVALARASALDPMMNMYDEPFTGLDPISKGVIVELIHTINEALGVTSIVASHDVQEAAAISDYIYVLSGGKVGGHGTPNALAESESPWVRQFMQGLADGPVPFHYPAPDYAADLLAGPGRGRPGSRAWAGAPCRSSSGWGAGICFCCRCSQGCRACCCGRGW